MFRHFSLLVIVKHDTKRLQKKVNSYEQGGVETKPAFVEIDSIWGELGFGDAVAGRQVFSYEPYWGGTRRRAALRR